MHVSQPDATTRFEIEETPDSTPSVFKCSVTGDYNDAPIHPGILTLFYENGECTGWDWDGFDNDDDTRQSIIDSCGEVWEEVHGS